MGGDRLLLTNRNYRQCAPRSGTVHTAPAVIRASNCKRLKEFRVTALDCKETFANFPANFILSKYPLSSTSENKMEVFAPAA
mmetsp:Transcript_9735/g.21784  ORF Transcript_9735/g.21784 Transcript_9735/m.21784 type:complete len:82 (-) Transcript_9735:3525-3770(-)